MEKIAIIGLSCLFPDAKTPEDFWRNLLDGKSSVCWATEEQMGVDPDLFYDPAKGKSGETGTYYCKRGGFIQNFQFEPKGYHLPANFLASLDSIYQWSLYVAKYALVDSGYLDDRAILSRCGLILGNLSPPTKLSRRLVSRIYQKAIDQAMAKLWPERDFSLAKLIDLKEISPFNLLTSGYPSAIVAQALALSGIYFSLDAACASSLYAIKIASQYLLSGKADLMLAGAVSRSDPFMVNTAFSVFQAYPENDDSRPLDSTSTGLNTGEGAGMVVLKRYSDAVRDKDRIYATILGLELSNDGKGKHYLSPNPKGQKLAFERTYASAGIDPSSIDYVECHGTGTPLGDRTEFNSMEDFFGKYGSVPLVGSVKSNLGHLLTAAGMPSILKVILSMSGGVIPPTINVSKPLTSQNQTIGSQQIVTRATPWPNSSSTKRAAVSAFGFGGTNSHLILEQNATTELAKTTTSIPEPKMAIVGMDAYFGSCKSLEEFERYIYQGKQSFREVPEQRWKGIETQAEILREYGFEEKAPRGAYIEDFEIDYLKFKILPDASDRPIPQQLLMLKVAENALQDAGLTQGGNVATIVAMTNELSIHALPARCDLSWQIQEALARANLALSPDKLAQLEQVLKESLHPTVGVNQALSFIGNIMASRISSRWDFSGPAFTISAEENSVFKALEVAQLLLADSNLDAVVIGAVDLAGGAENVLLRQQVAKVNNGNATLSYDRHANGWLVGEGAGAVVLKRIERARKDRDRIYAVIDAVSLSQNNTDAANSPNPQLVKQACEDAFAKAEIEPGEIGYLEVFGSGVESEDRVEIQGLLKAYQNSSTELNCALGSVKANIGHTHAASGMASLIKTALCLYHEYIPATPQWTAPKQPELWHDSPFYVATESRHWYLPSSVSQRIAAINGLGIDRTCAHVILAEELHHRPQSSNYTEKAPLYLFPLAAGDRSTLLKQLDFLEKTIAECDSLAIAAKRIYALFQQQSQTPYALTILGRNHKEINRELEQARKGIALAFEQTGEWKTPLGSYFTAKPLGRKGGVSFVYPGGFSSYLGMGREIYHIFPQIRDLLASFSANPSVKQLIYTSSLLVYPRSLKKLSGRQLEAKEIELLDDSLSMLMSSVILSMGFTEIVQNYFQVQPQFAFGYSLGEASMMFALNVWKQAEHLASSINSSSVFKEQLSGPKHTARQYWGLPLVRETAGEDLWKVYALMAPAERVIDCLKNYPRAYLTHINAPEEVVIAGDPQSCLQAIEQLGCNYFIAPFDHVIHCEPTLAVRDELIDWFTIPVEQVPSINFYCAARYAPMNLESNTIARNLANGLCQPLDFRRLVEKVYEDGGRIFIELGAGNTCSRAIAATLGAKEHAVMAIDNRGVDSLVSIYKVLAQLVSHRVPVELSPLYSRSDVTLNHKKSLLKTVTLGGCQIASSILSAENRQKFASATLSTLPKSIKTDKKIEPVVRREENQLIGAKAVNANGKAKLERVNTSPPSDNFENYQPFLNKTHAAFLRSRQESLRYLSEMIGLQLQVSRDLLQSHLITTTPRQSRETQRAAKVIFDEGDLLEFARGNIAPVFGKEYEIIDSYPRRVRLPMPPYLFISRVTKFNAKRGRYEPCEIETEYDISLDTPFAFGDNQIPCAIPVEASHGSILLISYIGIDFENQGRYAYRVLDGTSTFLSELPRVGETFRCLTRIDSFIKNNKTLLYFFTCDYWVGDRKFLELKAGAGFFLDEQLKKAQGVSLTKKEQEARSKIQKQRFEPLLHCQKTTFTARDLHDLHLGKIARCFGENYEQKGRNSSLRLSPPAILMLDRVIAVNPDGGTWGLGLLVGEKDLDPQAWYMNCHFKDDLCLPGTLIYEGASQLLTFYALYLGLQTRTINARFEPIFHLTQSARSRGQIVPQTGKLIYQLEVFEIGLEPKPYIKAESAVSFKGKTISIAKNLGVQLSEK